MSTAVIGNLVVRIGSETRGLVDGVRQAETGFHKLDRVIGGSIKAMAALGAAAVAAGAAITIALVKSSLNSIDAQSKLAYRLNGTIAGLQAVEYAADLAGVSYEALSKQLGRVNTMLAQAARTGSGPAYEALRRLGLSADALLKMDVDQRLGAIADAFERLGYTTDQQADALKQLGLRSQEILNLFEGGAENIRKARKEIKEFGGELTNLDGVAIEQANDAWTTAGRLVKAMADVLAVTLAPIIKRVADNFVAAGKEAGGFKTIVQGVARQSVVYVGMVVDKIHEIIRGFDDLKLTAQIANAALAVPQGPVATYRAMSTVVETLRARLKAVKDSSGPDQGKAVEWGKWFDEVSKLEIAAAQQTIDERKKREARGRAVIDPLTTEERKAMNDKLLQFRRSLANEGEALRLQREADLNQLKELESKKGFVVEDAARLRVKIEEKYQKEKQELINSKLAEGAMTEVELLKHKHEQMLLEIKRFEEDRTITENEANNLRRKYAEKNTLALLQLQASQYSALAGIVDTSMGHIKEAMGKEGGAAFQIMKGISMATALVKGYEAVLGAYAAGNVVGGPPVGAAFAAVAAAGVAAQIANIARTQPGSGAGGGSVTAPSGGGATAAQPAAPSSQQTLVVRGLNSGQFFDQMSVKDLARKLVDFQRDGGKVVLES